MQYIIRKHDIEMMNKFINYYLQVKILCVIIVLIHRTEPEKLEAKSVLRPGWGNVV